MKKADWDTADLLPGDMIISLDGNIILIINIEKIDRTAQCNYFGCLFLFKNEIPLVYHNVQFSQKLAHGHILVKL